MKDELQFEEIEVSHTLGWAGEVVSVGGIQDETQDDIWCLLWSDKARAK